MSQVFTWLNPPPRWSGDAAALEMETGPKTDFWRRTFYGFERDNGHAWLTPVDGDFSASVRFRGAYETLYDQAGLMLRRDAETWIKAGIEFTDGILQFSTVVTDGRSDWSVIPLPDAGRETQVWLRLTRHGEAVRVQFALDGAPWRLARLAPFPADPAAVGLMACSPERGGFIARFAGLAIGPAISRDLHAD